MERIFKFRAWDKKDKEMKCWNKINEGLLLDLEYEENYLFMQYTGLKDKNDKEVYESDIFEWMGGCVEVVEWDEELNGWSIDKAGLSTGDVIGNIYENEDLMGEKQ